MKVKAREKKEWSFKNENEKWLNYAKNLNVLNEKGKISREATKKERKYEFIENKGKKEPKKNIPIMKRIKTKEGSKEEEKLWKSNKEGKNKMTLKWK